MLIFTPEGWRSVDDRDVLYIYRNKPNASRLATATLCLASGEEITGRALITALVSLEAKLDDFDPPPPMAA